jgi:hypothetical protein
MIEMVSAHKKAVWSTAHHCCTGIVEAHEREVWEVSDIDRVFRANLTAFLKQLVSNEVLTISSDGVSRIPCPMPMES